MTSSEEFGRKAWHARLEHNLTTVHCYVSLYHVPASRLSWPVCALTTRHLADMSIYEWHQRTTGVPHFCEYYMLRRTKHSRYIIYTVIIVSTYKLSQYFVLIIKFQVTVYKLYSNIFDIMASSSFENQTLFYRRTTCLLCSLFVSCVVLAWPYFLDHAMCCGCCVGVGRGRENASGAGGSHSRVEVPPPGSGCCICPAGDGDVG